MITPKVGKQSSGHRAGQNRPWHVLGRRAKDKDPGFFGTESFRPSKSRSRSGSSSPHWFIPVFQPCGLSQSRENCALWRQGPADQGPRSSRSAEAEAPSLHRAPVARLLRFFSLLSSLQRPHKGKKETKKTTTGG